MIKKILLSIFVVIAVLIGTIILIYYPENIPTEDVSQVPFELRRNVIVTKMYLNGKGPYSMVVDTGTDPSVIDIDVVKELDIYNISLGEQEVGENKRIDIVVPTPIDVKWGDLPAGRKLFLALDLGTITERLGFRIDGIIGHNILRDNIVQIDYSNELVNFYTDVNYGEHLESNENLQKFEMHYIDDGTFPAINAISINGKPFTTTVDTGFNESLLLYKEGIEYLGLEDMLDKTLKSTTVGYGGAHEIYQLDTVQLNLGIWPITISGVIADISSKKAQVPLDIRGGNIGNALLSQYLVTFDYLNDVLYLIKQ